MNGVFGDTRRLDCVGRALCHWRRGMLALSMICSCAALILGSDPSWFSPAQAQDPPLPPRAEGTTFPTPDEPIVDVRIEGNVTIPAEAIAKFIKTRPGRPPVQSQIREDVQSLYRTRWFFSIEPRYRATDEGLVIIFRVLERPVVMSVEYRGNKKIKTKQLAARTGLKEGSPFDVSANRESAHRIEEYYHERGYTSATVKLVKGDDKNDREIIFEIEEGPKVRVTRIKFTGNDAFSGPLLKTKLRTKTAVLWLIGGIYDPGTIPDDTASLRQYYHNLGYFDVEIDHDVTFNKKRSHARIEYVINEGQRFKIRNVKVLGNNIYSAEQLKADMELVEGDYFNTRFLNKDVAKLKNRYGKLGRLFAKVEAVPVFLEEPGVADLVYRIDEDRVYRIRRIDVVINGDNPHTKRSVVLNNSLIFPGDLADPRQIRRAERRIAGVGVFERGPQNGVRVQVTRVNKNDSPSRTRTVRGQSAEPSFPGTGHSLSGSQRRQTAATTRQPRRRISGPPARTDFVQPVAPAVERRDIDFRGQSFENPGPLERPGMPFFGNNPQGNPLTDPLYQPLTEEEVDIIFHATEARTGRLMFGVGVNSDAGVVGSIVLTEQNFDILRPPTSLRDLINGTAWRGAGQRFRAEAVPGNIVSRYLVNWTDPYFLDTNYSLGVSGFFYNRFFPDWDEERTGGRLSVGRQFTPVVSLTSALRLENIELTNPDFPTPALLAASVGTNRLSTIRLTGTHDTRDSAFLPGEGHKIDLSFEQAFGDFDYPRAEFEARQYFTVFSRPDGGGRHIVSVGGQLGWVDEGTPIFERYFAGGFQTFRGFEFRGVGPRQFGTVIGGRWLAIGSVEYMLPMLANETIQAVAFSDFGTVEEDVAFDEFRVSVGFGLRITIPAMGPVPLAFDWAFPISRQDADETRIFSFYVGVTR